MYDFVCDVTRFTHFITTHEAIKLLFETLFLVVRQWSSSGFFEVDDFEAFRRIVFVLINFLGKKSAAACFLLILAAFICMCVCARGVCKT
jgi:hypothetical protein